MNKPSFSLCILRSPASLRTLIFARSASTDSLPRIAQPSLWTSLIPKPLRRSPPSPTDAPRTPHWLSVFWANPMTPVLLLSLLVGSQAIQTLSLKNEMLAYSRRSEGKIGLLREVIRRVQSGEDVDVEGILGTGDAKAEEEWFDVIKEIEEEERILSRKMKKAAREADAKIEEEKAVSEEREAEARGKPTGPMFM